MIPDHVLAAHLQGEAVLLDLETKRYYRLNETAARIWKGLEQSLAPDQITDILVAEFDVDSVTARVELGVTPPGESAAIGAHAWVVCEDTRRRRRPRE